MKCPYCSFQEDKVIDSRPTNEGAVIRRRRECLGCGRRFTTFEQIEDYPIYVIKRDGSRQAFDPEKLRRGILKSCAKRPVSAEDIDDLISEVKNEIYRRENREIKAEEIGELIINGLRDIDEVAYIRFASVYREFDNLQSFLQELQAMQEK